MQNDSNIEHILNASEDGLFPLFFHALKKSNPQFTLPVDEGKRKRLCHENAARNLYFYIHLKPFLEGLNRSGLKAIVLKGAALAANVYPRLGLRPFGDIDLLIEKRDLPRLEKSLRGSNYRPSGLWLKPGAEEFQGALPFKAEDSGMVIELHWTLGPPYPYAGRLNMAGIWERARKTRIAGVDTFILCPEDFLIHLCLHLIQHLHEGWFSCMADIAELIHYHEAEIDWQAFLDRVFKSRISLPVRCSLQKTVELLHPPLPASVLERLNSYEPDRREKWVFASIERPGSSGWVFAQIFTMQGISLRLRYLRTMLFPSKSYMTYRYHITDRKLLPFYYLRRQKEIFSSLSGLWSLIKK